MILQVWFYSKFILIISSEINILPSLCCLWCLHHLAFPIFKRNTFIATQKVHANRRGKKPGSHIDRCNHFWYFCWATLTMSQQPTVLPSCLFLLCIPGVLHESWWRVSKPLLLVAAFPHSLSLWGLAEVDFVEVLRVTGLALQSTTDKKI